MRFFTGIFAGLAALAGVNAASLQQVPNFGANPSGARMYIYVPDNVASNPAVIVAVHYCTGTAQAYYSGTPYARLADQHGFIVVYPESPYDGGCWDVSSLASLRRDGGGSSNAIANMVRHTVQQYQADASRVFVTGTSSGAMMTNVLCATYPDLFAAASSYAGVAAGCFYTGTVAGWNSTCSSGQEIHSQATWRDTALAMYPGYTGPRPRIQIYHGAADDLILPQNWNEAVKQWTGVFGYPEQAVRTEANSPASGYTRHIYGENVQGIYGQGVGHNIPVFGEEDLKWFGIIGGNPNPSPTPSPSSTTLSTSTRTPDPTPTTSPGGPEQTRWGQCGGIGWSGPTKCQSPWTCNKLNDWYYQCL